MTNPTASLVQCCQPLLLLLLLLLRYPLAPGAAAIAAMLRVHKSLGLRSHMLGALVIARDQYGSQQPATILLFAKD